MAEYKIRRVIFYELLVCQGGEGTGSNSYERLVAKGTIVPENERGPADLLWNFVMYTHSRELQAIEKISDEYLAMAPNKMAFYMPDDLTDEQAEIWKRAQDAALAEFSRLNCYPLEES